MLQALPVLSDSQLDTYLEKIDVPAVLEQTFAALQRGEVVQPPQSLTLFPADRGDCISYQGILGNFDVFGVKLSPYIPTGSTPIITAWTMLMSMKTGQPLLVCDSGRLTRERTAATTALAIDKLAPAKARVLAMIGSGDLAHAHLRYAGKLRQWDSILVYSPNLGANPVRQENLKALDPRVRIADSAEACTAEADVVMLVTSSGKPVLAAEAIGQSMLVTSISTNVAKAHEIDPACLSTMDVYCDYLATTPSSAGEMVLAAASGDWTPEKIKGDLAGLCAGTCSLPDYNRPVFFRSIGLGIEDIAMAFAIYKQIGNQTL